MVPPVVSSPAPNLQNFRADGPRKPRKALRAATYLTEQEIEVFFRVILDPRDRAIFRLIYHRGLRASEPGRLQFTDYRPGPGKPRLLVRRCKGSITAEHFLVETEIRTMKAWLRVRGSKPGPLFPSRNAARTVYARGAAELRGISPDMIEVLMLRYCLLAGIPREKAHPHSLKHSTATHLGVLLKGNVLEIQDHMGHADVRNTMRYLRATERETRGERLAGWGT